MIDITENAIKRIRILLSRRTAIYFRISVDGGGCQDSHINLLLTQNTKR